ncbi:MAG: selenium cofactor biosynthesis protein YqeC [Oscillospiraceae bacterium]
MLWEKLGLDLDKLRVVTLVGGGGKTTLLYALANQAAALGKTVCITTTTHMFPHPDLPSGNVVQEGQILPDGKLTLGPSIEWCRSQYDLVLVEGDGAHGRPLKVPGVGEPVIPPESDGVICVAGMSALGGRIVGVCHRPELVCALLKKPGDGTIAPEDYVTILSSNEGGRKGLPVGVAYRCVLNQAEGATREQAAAEIIEALKGQNIWAVQTAFEEKERGGLCLF